MTFIYESASLMAVLPFAPAPGGAAACAFRLAIQAWLTDESE
jgi:hypothetical protein